MLINTLFEIELPPVTMKLPFYVDSNVYYVTLSEDVVRNYVKEALKEVLGHEADQHTLNRVHHDYVCNMKPMMNCPCSIFDSLPPLTQEMTVELNEYCRPLVDLAGKRWNGEVVDTAELQKLGDEGKSKLFSSPYIEVFAYVFKVMEWKKPAQFTGYEKLRDGQRIKLPKLSKCLDAFRSEFKDYYAHMDTFCRLVKTLYKTVNSIHNSQPKGLVELRKVMDCTKQQIREEELNLLKDVLSKIDEQ